MITFAQYLSESFFGAGHTFSSNGLTYNVPEMVKWAAQNYPARNVNIRKLLISLYSPGFHADEKLGSPEWAQRAWSADPKYPVVVVRYDDGKVHVADGNHRLWAAFQKWKDSGFKKELSQIKAYFIPYEDLKSAFHPD